MNIKYKELNTDEMENVFGGGFDVPMLNEIAAGICSFFDGFNKKKYRGKC